MKKIRFWATQAREPARHYEHKEIGYNYRMSNICAAIGRGQLKTLNERINKRKTIYEKYRTAFKNLPINMMPILKYGTPNYWLSVAIIEKGSKATPEDIIVALENENIESRPLWKPMHMQPVFKTYPFFSHYEEECVSEDLFMRGVCLPSGSSMSMEEIEKIIDIAAGRLLSCNNEIYERYLSAKQAGI